MGLPWNVNASMGGAGVNDQILRSLRFRASATAYMARTPSSASNQTTWTWSAWVKKGNNSSYGCMFGAYTGAGATYTVLQWQNDNTLVFYNQTSSSVTMNLNTTQVFRDPSAWYHVVAVYDSTQATSSNRGKIYINGVQVTAFSTATYPSLNANATVNSAVPHDLGRFGGAANYFDGYLAEVNFIDGQALTPSSFGYYDPQTGVWQPAPFKGTYGTNGFYLPFTDIATTSGSNFGLGRDYSGNSNYWNTNNISVTSGTTYDSMIDSPTNFSDGSTYYNRGNYATLNSIGKSGGTITDGNLQWASGGVDGAQATATIALLPNTGKFYCEILIGSKTTIYWIVGLVESRAVVWSGTAVVYYGQSPYQSIAQGDIIGIAVDTSNGAYQFYKNGSSTSMPSGTITLTGQPIYFGAVEDSSGGVANYTFNFGQRPFSYTPPTGYKALNTFNLTTPTIANGAAYMAATLYTGNGSTQSISNGANTTIGTTFQPDFVWIKQRSSSRSHRLVDSVRGVGKELYSDLTLAEATDTNGLTSFNSNGYSIGSSLGYNTSAATYVAWQWNAGAGTTSTNTSGSITSTVSANTTAGFSVVTFNSTGTTGSYTVGHGLGVAPNMIIVKDRTNVAGWPVYHSSATTTNQYLALNSTAAVATVSNIWGTSNPTSSVFGVTTGTTFVASANIVAYCFAAVRGYSAFGSYSANGSTDGPFIYTGFRPRFILSKRTDSSTGGNWQIEDTSRATYNVVGPFLRADTSDAEGSGTLLDILSNGFKLRTTDTGWNASGGTYIYAAFAENPFQYARAR